MSIPRRRFSDRAYNSQSTRTFYLRGLTTGSATITATMNDGGATAAVATFTVNAASSQLTWTDIGGTNRIASGMQQEYRVALGTSSPSGSQLTLSSSDPSRVFFSLSRSGAGQSTLLVPLTTGTTQRTIYVQTLPGTPKDVEIVAQVPNYADGNAIVSLEAGMLRFDNLTTARTGTEWANYPDDTFYVEGGVSNGAATNGITLQYVSPATSSIAVTCQTSNGTGSVSSPYGSVAYIAANTEQTPTSFAAGGFVHQNGVITSGSYTVTCSAPGFNPVSANVTLTVTPVTITFTPSGGVQDVRVGRGLQRTYQMVLSHLPPVATSFYLEPRNASRAALTASSTATQAQQPLTLTFSTSQSTRAFYLHGGPELGAVTFDVWCQSGCSLPDKTFTVNTVAPRVNVGSLDINYVYNSVDPMPADIILTQVGIQTTTNTFDAQLVSYVYGPLFVPVQLSNPVFQWAGSYTGVTLQPGTSQDSANYAVIIPPPPPGGSHTLTVSCNGNGWDPNGTTDTRTVTYNQYKLDFTVVGISNSNLYTTVDVTLRNAHTNQLVNVDGTITISFVSGAFNGLSSDSTTTLGPTATIGISGTETTEQVRVYGQGQGVGTQATLRAVWNSNPTGMTPAEATFTIVP